MVEADLGSMILSIDGSSEKAEQAIDKLISRLQSLKTALSDSANTKSLTEGIKSLSEAAKSIGDASNIREFAKSLGELSKIKDLKISDKTIGTLTSLGYALTELGALDLPNMGKIASNIKQLDNLKDVSIPKNFAANLKAISEGIVSLNNASTNPESISATVDALKKLKEISIPKGLKDKIVEFSNAISNLASGSLGNLEAFANAVQKLSGIDLTKFRFNKDIGTQLSQIAESMTKFNEESFANLERFVGIVTKLQNVDLSGFTNAVKISSKEKSRKTETSEQNIPDLPDTKEFNEKAASFQFIGEMASNVLPAVKSLAIGIGEVAIELAKAVVSDFVKTLKDMGHTALSAAKALGKMAWNVTPFHKIPESIGNAAKALKGFTSSLERIAMYRAIRTAMKELTEGLDQAIQGIYNFESAAGHKFGSVMDGLKTNVTELTGNIGVLAANLISLLAPALNTIMNILNQVVSALASFFALLGGKVFVKATGDAQKFGNAAKSGSAATKEWRNQLLAFDEINRLEDQNDGGGGGGSGNNVNPYTFEKADLLDWQKDIQDAINSSEWYKAGALLANHFNQMLDQWDAYSWGNMLGSKIEAGIEIALGFVETFDFGKVGTKLAQAVNGIFLQVKGENLGRLAGNWFNAPWKVINKFLEELNAKKIGEEVGKAVDSWFKTIDSDLISETANKALQKVLESMESFISEFSLAEAVGKVVGTIESTINAWAETISETTILDDLIDWVDEVDWEDATSRLSKGVTNLLNSITDKLKGLDKEKIKSNIKEAFDGVDWAGLFEAIASLAWQWFKTKWQLKFALTSSLVSSVIADLGGVTDAAVEAQQTAQDAVASALANGEIVSAQYDMIQEIVANGYKTWEDAYEQVTGNALKFEELATEAENAATKAKDMATEVSNITSNLSGTATEAENATTAINDITSPLTEAAGEALSKTKEIEDAATAAGKLTQEEIGDAIKTASEDFNTAIEEMTTSLETFTTEIGTQFETAQTNISTTLGTISTEFSTESSAWQKSVEGALAGITTSVSTESTNWLNTASLAIAGIQVCFNTMALNAISAIDAIILELEKIPSEINVVVNTLSGIGIKNSTPRFFANGGFPESGQLFVARENNLPEMVGTFGGQTAVANNGQIVEGISQGVYQAVSAAMSENSNGNGETVVKVYLDSQEIKTGQRRLSRAMGI